MTSSTPAPEQPANDAVRGNSADFTPLDCAMAAALHDCPVPAGLAERVIERIGVAQNVADASQRRSWFISRRAVIAAGSLAIVVLVGLGIALLRPTTHVVSRESLSSDVSKWLPALLDKDWRPATTLPGGIEVDFAVLGRPQRWQYVRPADSSRWSGSVVAVDLGPPKTPRAVLFVVRTNSRFAVPSTPMATAGLGLSSGYVATAWQRSSNVLYVLVVEVDRGRRLEDFLRAAPQA